MNERKRYRNSDGLLQGSPSDGYDSLPAVTRLHAYHNPKSSPALKPIKGRSTSRHEVAAVPMSKPLRFCQRRDYSPGPRDLKHDPVGRRGRQICRCPEPAQIGRDKTKAIGEPCHLGLPSEPELPPATQQKQRPPLLVSARCRRGHLPQSGSVESITTPLLQKSLLILCCRLLAGADRSGGSATVDRISGSYCSCSTAAGSTRVAWRAGK